jgi:hypothetical protein
MILNINTYNIHWDFFQDPYYGNSDGNPMFILYYLQFPYYGNYSMDIVWVYYNGFSVLVMQLQIP